ncbi:MAG: NF038122 family metalloprotease [Calothrix sp. MO_192.B10]|nr:NF038122 family metalloprotease [Calothrix sp. MO_192.B10]
MNVLSTKKEYKPSIFGDKHQRKPIYQYLVAPLALAAALILGNNAPASALKINLTYGANVTQEQKEAAELAALIWESYITDPITVNIHLDMSELPWGKMGAAIPNLRTNYNYDAFKTKAESEAELAGQNTDFLAAVELAEQNTYSSPTVELAEQNTSSSPTPTNPDDGLFSGYKIIYQNGTIGTTDSNIMITGANAMALGLSFNSQSVLHGYIQLNSRYNWSYKYAQGTVDKNSFDFTSVVLHEIGHNLGFISGIDPAPGTAKPSSLDMFRCSDYSAKLGAIDFTVDSQRRYFSIDGCQTVFTLAETEETTNKKGDIVTTTRTYEALFARGTNRRLGGDGTQASHWADNNPDPGIMNPLLQGNTKRKLTGIDLTAMDYIGYDVDHKKYYQTDANGDYILDSKGNKIVKPLDFAFLSSQAQIRATGDNYRPQYSPDNDDTTRTEVEKFMDESGIYYWGWDDSGDNGDCENDPNGCVWW